MEDPTKGTTTPVSETIEKAKAIGRNAIDKGYETACEYA